MKEQSSGRKAGACLLFMTAILIGVPGGAPLSLAAGAGQMPRVRDSILFFTPGQPQPFSPEEIRSWGRIGNKKVLEQKKILYLLTRVSASPHVFVREGESFDGVKAAAHLRWKFGYVKHRIETAREFIDHIASSSSLTGHDYLLKSSGGVTLPVRTVFYNELEYLEQEVLSGLRGKEEAASLKNAGLPAGATPEKRWQSPQY